MTYRDPIDPALFPRTSPAWSECSHGAQRAGLIRLEALVTLGGVYVDSDVEPYRPFDPLLYLPAFAAWEDARVIPDAVLGCVPGHPAFELALKAALDRLPKGPWESGPGVTTAYLARQPDVLVLPPGAFFPYHYKEKHRRHEDHRSAQPWAFAAHHWAGSWLPKGG